MCVLFIKIWKSLTWLYTDDIPMWYIFGSNFFHLKSYTPVQLVSVILNPLRFLDLVPFYLNRFPTLSSLYFASYFNRSIGEVVLWTCENRPKCYNITYIATLLGGRLCFGYGRRSMPRSLDCY